jgi:radical SAM protein with 4Fe4S-binding SPASM domain
MKTIPLDEFMQQVQVREPDARVYDASLEITWKCNFACGHCYVPRPAAAGLREMTFPEIRRTIDGLVRYNTLSLLLTGGEPLLRPDFCEIYEYAARAGLRVFVNTNGSLIREEHRRLFKAWPPVNISITLYGLHPATFRKTTGQGPEVLKTVVENIRSLRTNKIPFNLRAMALPALVPELEALNAFAARECPHEFFVDTNVHNRIDGTEVDSRHKLTPGEQLAVDRLYLGQKDLDLIREAIDQTPDTGTPGLFQCSAGQKMLHLDAFGRLHPCIVSRFQPYDLRNGDFETAFKTFLPSFRQRAAPAAHQCSGCKLINICDSCPGHNWLATGSAEGFVESYCTKARLRDREFIHPDSALNAEEAAAL